MRSFRTVMSCREQMLSGASRPSVTGTCTLRTTPLLQEGGFDKPAPDVCPATNMFRSAGRFGSRRASCGAKISKYLRTTGEDRCGMDICFNIVVHAQVHAQVCAAIVMYF